MLETLTNKEDGEGDEEQEDMGHHSEGIKKASIVEHATIHIVGDGVVLTATEGQGHGAAWALQKQQRKERERRTRGRGRGRRKGEMLRRCRILSVSSYILAAGGEQKAGKFTFCMHTKTCLHRISKAPAQPKNIPLITVQAQCKKKKYGCSYTLSEDKETSQLLSDRAQS